MKSKAFILYILIFILLLSCTSFALSEEEIYKANALYEAKVRMGEDIGAYPFCVPDVELRVRLKALFPDLIKRDERAVREEAFAYDALEIKLTEKLSTLKGKWSLYFEDTATGKSFTINNERVRAASVIKIFVLATVYEKMEAGTFPNNDYVNNLIYNMITVSDNDAWYSLTTMLGGRHSAGMSMMTDFARRNGMNDTGNLAYHCTTSAYDTGLFISKLLKGEIVSESASEKIISLMKQQRLLSKIPSGVPKGVVTANKTGEDETIQNDAAIIYADGGAYILVIMTDGAYIPSIRDVSAFIYDEVITIRQ